MKKPVKKRASKHGSLRQQKAFGITCSLLNEYLGRGEEAWQLANWLARSMSKAGYKVVRYKP